jgi:hypothetical protein
MANKEKSKVRDAQVTAGNEIYNIARKQADEEIARLKSEIEAIREEGRIEGYLAKVEYDISHNEFLRIMALYKMKQSKDYKKGGRTWVEFCESHGYPQRTADRLLEELKPIFDRFSCQLADFFGISFNKIRLLGRSINSQLAEIKDGCLVYDDQLIPLDVDHKDEIEAVIDQLKENAEKNKSEKELEVKAKERVLRDKEKHITKLTKNLEMLEGKAREKNLTPAEEGFLKQIEFLRTAFDGYLLQLEPERVEELQPDSAPTPRMRAAYLAALDYMKKQILVAFEKATEMYGNAVMCPEAAWKPGMSAAITPAKESSKKNK